MSNALTRLKELVARKNLDARLEEDAKTLQIPPAGIHIPKPDLALSTSGPDKITYNLQQAQFISLALSGKSCALIGPAGTGKTTCTKGAIFSLIQSGKIPTLQILNHAHLNSGVPGIICTSFTNKAVQNTKRILPLDLRQNCLTIHKLLEFIPEYYDVYDEKTGKYKKTMRFVPSRNASNPLPKSIHTIIIDEATMVPIDLWNRLFEALPFNENLQIILVGDIQQLPPVFGRSIFIHAMEAGIPKVELTEVYRQALESPIISLAHRILSGKVIPKPELEEWNIDKPAGKLTVRPWKKALGIEASLLVMSKFLPEMIDSGDYSPYEDTILTPYNKAFGTIELNKIVATHLAKKYNPDNEPVYEIIAGINKKYFRVGDKVLHNKTEHVITAIEKNKGYFGKPFRPASVTLDYEGIEHDSAKKSALASLLTGEDSDASNKSIDDLLNSFASIGDEKEDLTKQCSHKVTVYSEEFDSFETLETSGDVGSLDLGYAITIHKAQGSEYRRVFFITHASQANMLFRELLYTGITRAREELYIVCPPSLFVSGITSQRLPGVSLEAKIEAFERTLKLSKQSEEEKPKGLYLFQQEKSN